MKYVKDVFAPTLTFTAKSNLFFKALKAAYQKHSYLLFFSFREQQRFSLASYLMPILFQKKSITCCYMFILLFFLSFFAFSENKHSIKIKQLVVFHLRVNININNKQVFNFCNTTKTEKTRLKIPSIFFFQLLYF